MKSAYITILKLPIIYTYSITIKHQLYYEKNINTHTML